MLLTSRLPRPLAVAALCAAAATAHATPTLYTSQASFLAAAIAPATDSFNDLAQGPVAAPLMRSTGPYSYQASALFNTGGTSGFYNSGTPGDTWLSADSATDVIAFTAFSSNVRAVGGFFFATTIAGALQAGESLVLTATDATGTLSHTITNAGLSSFRGFVSTSGITSLTVSVVEHNGQGWATVNDLQLASAVPEPAAWAMFAGGLLALAAHRRRRSTRAV